MKIRADQLAAHSKKGLSPIYWVCGDEALLVQECCEALRKIAHQQGFIEHERYHVDNRFDWNEITTSANSMSLFASRKVIDIRLTAGKLDEAAGKSLQRYLTSPSPDTILLLSGPKLETSASRNKTYKAIDQAGCIIQIWPIEGYQLNKWIDARLKKVGLKADSDACQLLAERVEGNLLAAVQEIEKLALLIDGNTVSVDTITEAVADNARYTIFNLSDKMLDGKSAESLKVLNGLRAEGSEAILVLWALTREIRTLCQLSTSNNINTSFKQLRIFDRKQPVYKKILQRLSSRQCHQALDHCRRIDAMIKGAEDGNVWDEISRLVLSICGHSLAA